MIAIDPQIPERVSQCRCYFDNARLSCTGELTLPNHTRPTVDIMGAGIAGTISTPTRGNLDSMQATFTSRVLTAEMTACFAPGVHDLEFRAIIQGIDALGNSVEMTFSSFMRVMARGITRGVINNGAEMGASAEFEVLAERTTVNGVLLCDINKTNNIMRFRNANGELVDDNAVANDFLRA